jgi:hypothetical protein
VGEHLLVKFYNFNDILESNNHVHMNIVYIWTCMDLCTL